METALKQVLTSSYKADMISYMAAHPEDFDEAIELALSDSQPYSWRAAWLLWSCMEENDQRVHRYIKQIINAIKHKNDGHQRELIKILLQMKLTEEYESFLFDVCVTAWKTVNKTPSVRFTAFKMMLKIAKKYPGLSNEIKLLTKDQYLDSLSHAAKHSISKMINELSY